MDWTHNSEQELQHIQTGRAQQQQHDPEYGYHAQQFQAQQQYSSRSESNFGKPYTPAIPLGQRLTAAISYVFGWVTGFVFFLFAEKRNRFVRFHALQSLIFFGGISVLGFVVGTFINYGMSYNEQYFSFLLFVPLVIAWIVFVLLLLMAIAGWFMGIVNALRGRYYKMPFVGDFVEQYINKQAMPK